jgi:hypothetical protein
MGLLIQNNHYKMKKSIIKIGVLFLMLVAMNMSTAQINRTLETKVADILAQLPTKDLNHCNKLMEEIIGLGTKGILQFCNMLVPAGTGNDAQARYAVQSLATYVGGKQNIIDNNLVEDAFLKALETTSNKGIKDFLINRLAFCGSNASISHLEPYLLDDQLYNSALGVLVEIGTPESSKIVLDTARKAKGDKLLAFVRALGVLRYELALGLLEQLAGSN